MLGEQLGGWLAAPQMLGAGLVPEAAEIDDSLDALALRHLGEVARGVSLLILEIARAPTTHRVDQVVGNGCALTCTDERLALLHVSDVELEAAVREPFRPG